MKWGPKANRSKTTHIPSAESRLPWDPSGPPPSGRVSDETPVRPEFYSGPLIPEQFTTVSNAFRRPTRASRLTPVPPGQRLLPSEAVCTPAPGADIVSIDRLLTTETDQTCLCRNIFACLFFVCIVQSLKGVSFWIVY